MKHFPLLALASGLSCLTPAIADTVTLPFNGLTLNGNLTIADEKQLSDGVFLITHGTLAHNGMELIQGLQETLADEGYNSLAVNLSLGLSDRTGMYDCNTAHQHHHTDAVAELNQWSSWLKTQGAGNIFAIGHSRGGNQTALYSAQNSTVAKQILIAPMTWQAEAEAQNYQQRYNQSLAPLLSRAEAMPVGQWLEDIDFIYCKNTRVTADSFVSYYRDDSQRDTPSLLQAVTTPTLVISGSEDKTVTGLPARMAEVQNSAVSHSDIEGADHYFRDLYLDDVVEQIIEFVEG